MRQTTKKNKIPTYWMIQLLSIVFLFSVVQCKCNQGKKAPKELRLDELGKDSKASDITVEPDDVQLEIAPASPIAVTDSGKKATMEIENTDNDPTEDSSGDAAGGLSCHRTAETPATEKDEVELDVQLKIASASPIAVTGSGKKATIEIENTGNGPIEDGSGDAAGGLSCHRTAETPATEKDEVELDVQLKIASASPIAVTGSGKKATIEIENTGNDPTADGDVVVVIQKTGTGDAELDYGSISGSGFSGTVGTGAVDNVKVRLEAITQGANRIVEIPIKAGTKPTEFSVSLQYKDTPLTEPDTSAKIAWKDKNVQLEIDSKKSKLQVVGKDKATIMITNKGDTIDKDELVLVIERETGDAELKQAEKVGGPLSHTFINSQHGYASEREIVLWDIVDERHTDKGWKNTRGVKIPITGGSVSEAEFKVSLQYKGVLLPELTRAIKWSKK